MLGWRKERDRQISRRDVLLLGGYGAATSLLALRLYWLQIEEGDNYARLGEKNRLGVKFLTPERGLLLDSKGRDLVVNRQTVRLSVVPEYTTDLRGVLERLSEWIDIEEEKVTRLLKRAKKQPSFVPILVESRLSWDKMMQIAVRAYEVPGVLIGGSFRRYYPYGEVFSHVIGYVGQLDEAREDADRLFLRLPDVQIGKSGVERVLDKSLRGKVGFREVESNAIGREVREIGVQPSKAGATVRLTLDLDLQRFLHLKMRNVRAGGAILVDPWSGAVRAMVSKPDFDPNLFSGSLSQQEWTSLQNQRPSLLLNRVLTQSYSPGSVFKLAVMLAALEAGVSEQKTTYCRGWIEEGEDKLHCWRKRGHGRLDMLGAVRESCDVWFYEIIKEIGLERVMATAKKLGYGGTVGDDRFPFEYKGFLPTKTWKQERFGIPWKVGDSLVAAIGQGYVSATLAQMAMMMSRLLTGGVTSQFHLVEGEDGGRQYGGENNDLGSFVLGSGLEQFVEIDPRHQEMILRATRQVVNHKRGTAYRLRLQQPGFGYAGKTGTSQVRSITSVERDQGVISNADLPWHLRDHSLFVGYAPVDLPRHVVAVIVEHGGSSTSAAVPIAREALLRVQAGFDYGLDT